MIDPNEIITRNSAICGGQPVIRGTRVLVKTILGYLADGRSMAEVIADFPAVTESDVRKLIAVVAASASEDLPPPSAHPFSGIGV